MRGKSFFLHLQGYKYKETLEQRLIHHGARVEKVLSKFVGYLVINRSATSNPGKEEESTFPIASVSIIFSARVNLGFEKDGPMMCVFKNLFDMLCIFFL